MIRILSSLQLAILVGFAGGAFAPVDAAEGKSLINKDAYALAKLLKPARLSAKVGEGDFDAAQKQLIRILEALERGDRTSGPRPKDMLELAYDHFVEGMNPQWKLQAQSALLKTWEEAHSLGLFDVGSKFTTKITRGPDTGKECVFEYIAPPDQLPLFSNDYANVRVVAPSKQRVGTELSPYDLAAVQRLSRIGEEALGIRLEEKQDNKEAAKAARAPWEREMAAAGDAAEAAPKLIFSGGITASPSKSNGERYEATLEITNLSRHPTEVEVECWFLGITGEKRRRYRMGDASRTVPLRAGEVWRGEFFSNPVNKFRGTVAMLDGLNPKNKKDKKKIVVKGRGWVARVLHKGEVIAMAASTNDLLPYAGEEFEALKALP